MLVPRLVVQHGACADFFRSRTHTRTVMLGRGYRCTSPYTVIKHGYHG